MENEIIRKKGGESRRRKERHRIALARKNIYIPHDKEVFLDLGEDTILGHTEGLRDPNLELAFKKMRQHSRQRFAKSQEQNKPPLK